MYHTAACDLLISLSSLISISLESCVKLLLRVKEMRSKYISISTLIHHQMMEELD